MSEVLRAYGPQDGGISVQGGVGLGQHLVRMTLEDGYEQQPLVSLDGQRVLVSDARLDNRPELTRELNISATQARELPDSSFILRAYERWGAECAGHLIGDFAFALWDGREQLLLLARSPLGGRALFYHVTPHRFAFATMPKGLFALADIPRTLDPEYLADYLTGTPTE